MKKKFGRSRFYLFMFYLLILTLFPVCLGMTDTITVTNETVKDEEYTDPCTDPANMDPKCLEKREWDACMDPTNMDAKCVEMRFYEACKQNLTSTDSKCVEMRKADACQKDQNSMDPYCVQMRKSEECKKNPSSTAEYCVQMRQWEACQDLSNTSSTCVEMRKADACQKDPASTDPFCVQMRQSDECKQNPDSTDPECLGMKQWDECEKNGFTDPMCQVLKQSEACKDNNTSSQCKLVRQWIECHGNTSDQVCQKAAEWEKCIRAGGNDCGVIMAKEAKEQEETQSQAGSREQTDTVDTEILEVDSNSLDVDTQKQQYIAKYTEHAEDAKITSVQKEKPALTQIQEDKVEHIPLESIKDIKVNQDLAIAEVELEKLQLKGASDVQDNGEQTPPSDLPDTGDSKETIGLMSLKGKGPANSEINIYIYSDPLIITTRTDENGNWVYTVDESLPVGRHEAYVSVSDEQGEVIARSNFFEFLVNKAVAADDSTTEDQTTSTNSNRAYLLPYILVSLFIVMSVVVALLLLRSRIRKKQRKIF